MILSRYINQDLKIFFLKEVRTEDYTDRIVSIMDVFYQGRPQAIFAFLEP